MMFTGNKLRTMNYKFVLIYGLGKAGINLARFLINDKIQNAKFKNGIKVYAYDDNPKVQESSEVKELCAKQNFQYLKNSQDCLKLPELKTNNIIVVISPGIPSVVPLISELKKKKVPIIDEVEFSSYFVTKPIIAVTGTNGKSTTTVLIGKMLEAEKSKVFYGGNLAPGLPFSAALLDTEKDYYVIEVSSFQLERCYDFRPKIAVLLNITEDHLDRHQSKAEYVASKFRVFAKQKPTDFAILNYDDPVIMKKQAEIPSQIVYFSTEQVVDGTYCQNQTIYFKGESVVSLNAIKIPGRHNLKNVLAAICGAKLVGVKNSNIEKALNRFNGLPHRLELVRELDGVRYINNSMCTNPEAAINSLLAITGPIILITGGKEKNLAIDKYIQAITDAVKYTILIGESRMRLKNKLEKLRYQNFELADSLEQAVRLARMKATKGDTVLFSPGFASFDAFTNFIERGEVFRNAVTNLT